MPLELPAKINEITRKLDTGTWLWRLDFTIAEIDDIIRLTNNTENITVDGNLYTRCPFTLGPVESSGTQLPHRTLSVTDEDLVEYLQPYVRQYDGIIDATVVVTPVNVENITLDMSNKSQEWQIIQTTPRENSIIFTLGAPNPLIQRFPMDRYGPSKCRSFSRFSLTECGYGGAGSCDGTYASCVTLGNEARFGAELGLRPKTTRWA